MKFHWCQFTAFRLLVPFILGIVFSSYYSIDLFLLGALLLFFTASLFVYQLLPISTFSRWRFLHALGFWLLFFTIGAWVNLQTNEAKSPQHFSHYLTDKNTVLLVEVNEPLVAKPNSYKTTVKVRQVIKNDSLFWTKGSTVVYFDKDSTQEKSIQYGDWLLVNDFAKPIAPPANPHQFDFRQYLKSQNIGHQLYLTAPNWQLLSSGNGHPFMEQIYRLRTTLLNILDKKIQGKAEKAIAAALLLGDKHLLEDDIRALYSSTGAMHVLAVSGLHVGIIMQLLTVLFAFVEKRFRYGSFIKLWLVVLGIWGFAFLTGLAPSVCRSALMFSLIAVGKHSKRNVSSLNIVAASAFILLTFNPYLLFQVGFQLSYSAVIAIIYLQPKLAGLWEHQYKTTDWLWQLTTVSLAATIGTLPLTLYYFHQFPVYFWLSNFIVIPAATGVVFLGVLTFITYPLGILGDWTSYCLEYLIWLTNVGLSFIQSLPNAVVTGISISSFQMWMLYCMLLFVLLFFRVKQVRLLQLTILLACLFFGETALKKWETLQQSHLTIYHLKNQSVLEFNQGKNAFLLTDSLTSTSAKDYRFNLAGNHLELGIDHIHFISPKEENPKYPFQFNDSFYQIKDKTLFILNKDLHTQNAIDDKMHLNYVLVKNSPFIDLDGLLDLFTIDYLIADGSNNYSTRSFLKKACAKYAIDFHSTHEDGAFVLDLNE